MDLLHRDGFMNINQSQSGAATILFIKGVIKLSESGKQLSDRLKTLLDTGAQTVLIDLSEVDEVDSTGLGELVGYLQLFSKKGRHLAVVKPTAKVQRLFEFMNLHKVMTIYGDMNEALAGEKA
jgi:anti-sigma B factor antagonist